MKILLDTNFLVTSIKFRIDFFSEIERICDFRYNLVIIDKTIGELKKINNIESKIALKLIKNKKVNIVKTKEGKVDDLILNIADKDYIIATQDKELRRRLRDKNIRLLTIRQKKYLSLN